MKLVTPHEMQLIDRLTIEKYNIPGLRLMENAGLSVALEILKRDIDLANIFVICGKGNNGGDGLVLARVLKIRGYNPKVILIPGHPYCFIYLFSLLLWQSLEGVK